MLDDRRFGSGVLLLIAGCIAYMISIICWRTENGMGASSSCIPLSFGPSLMIAIAVLGIVMTVAGAYLLARCLLDSRKSA